MLRYIVILVCFSLAMNSCKKEKDSSAFKIQKIQKDWMFGLMELYSEKEIFFSELCLPGSHDAGMYNLRKCTFGANSCNTQTQQLGASVENDTTTRKRTTKTEKVNHFDR